MSLMLINRTHPIKTPLDITLVNIGVSGHQVKMEKEAGRMLQKAIDDMHCHSFVWPLSGYRTEMEQIEIFQTSLEQNGKTFTEKYVAYPNCSEHQTGLAVDLGSSRKSKDDICPEFPRTGKYEAFRKCLPSYGFIERYPDGKQEVTGIGHEPWHFRYVGLPHAVIITEWEFTLEEYIAWLSRFTNPQRMVKYQCNAGVYEFFYVSAQSFDEAATCDAADQVIFSETNTGGFVVTLHSKTEKNGNVEAREAAV